MINKEIRRQGLAFKRLIPYWKKSTFKRINAIQRMGIGKTKYPIELKEYRLSNVNETRICVYSSFEPIEKSPVVIYFHGGGFAMGCPEIADSFYFELIKSLNVKVVSPDYTLSLNKPFPNAFNDCFDTLEWVIRNEELLGIDSSKVIIAGDSAGGGLCAAIAIKARDHGIDLLAQIPMYPMLDSDMKFPSAKDNEYPLWNSKSNENAWALYLDDVQDVNHFASPTKLTDFTNLAQAYSFIGTLDPFLDETKYYFKKLEEAKVKCELKVYEGCYHGFERVVPKAEVSKNANAFIIGVIEDILQS